MKISISCCFLLNLVFIIPVFSQTIENSINLYGTNFPQEKIHIHFDKETYLPGETIWFKAYLFEENLPSERSTNFYASLYDEDGKLIQQQVSPIFNSTTDGHFDIPDSLQSKQLICRAYTAWMLNFDTTFLFTKAIKLINNNAKEETGKINKTSSLRFFPEGGDIIEGTRNTIAFKANYNNGLPFEVNGVIKKQETGEVLMPLRSTHDGMGRFDIDIQSNEKYYAEWIDDKGATQQTYLPTAKIVGLSLKLTIQKNNLFYNLVNKLPNDSLHIIMYMYQKVFCKANLSVRSAEAYTGIVPIDSLPTGTMQLTVFDNNWQPVAERMAFINNGNYKTNITIINREISIQKRGKNNIEIQIEDTIPANMSLSITDAELNNEGANSTIVTNLLLGGDVKGYIHDPAYYFTNDTDAVLRSNLDLVMLTHGWRRYNWTDMYTGNKPVINYPADNYLSVYGQVSKTAMEKITKEENVNLVIKTKDSTNNFYSIWPDSTGLLKQTGLIFYDTAKVLFSFNKNKLWNPQMAFSRSNYTYSQPFEINNYDNYLIPDTAGIKFNQTASLFNYYNSNKASQPFNRSKTMETVVIKSGGWHNWKNDPMYLMEQRYTSGVFRTGAATAETYDVMHDEMASAKQDIYNYLGYKGRFLRIDYVKGGKQLVGPVFGGSAEVPLVFINEHLSDPSELESLLIENIAFVKVIYPYMATRDEHGHIKTALAIYYKKGDDLIDSSPKETDLKQVKVPGYAPIKEFYSPDYSESNTTMGTDARTTLLWRPYILTNAVNSRIPINFYNNDFSKKLKMILEGINAEGKMIHVEMIIE